MTNIFNSATDASPIDTTAIVEKYNGDQTKIVNALAHSQAHIARLEAEAREREQKIASSMTLEQAIAEIKAGITVPPSTTNQTPVTQSNVLDDNTLNQKVEELLNKKSKADRDTAAQTLVRNTLLEKFQTAEKATEEMNKKANELGMSADEFEALAIRSPKAVFQMLGIDGNKQVVNTAPNRSTVNVPARQASNPNQQTDGLSKYTAVLREPKGYEKYMSKDTQIKIMAEAMANPAAFGINV